MCEVEPRFFLEVRGVSPSDFSANAEAPEKRDEAVALANDVHDLLREKYGQTNVTGVVPVLNLEVHKRLVGR